MALVTVTLDDPEPNPTLDVPEVPEAPKEGKGRRSMAAPMTVAERAATMPEGAVVKGYVLGLVESHGANWLLVYLDRRRRDLVLIPKDDLLRVERDDVTNVDTVVCKRDA